MTRQRQIILSIVQNSPKHLTAEEIFYRAKAELPSIVLATVYNNLNALTEQNIVRRVAVSDRCAYFDKNVIPHDHIVCDCCGNMSDIYVGDLLSIMRERSGVDITSYELNLHYICDDCKEKQANSTTDNSKIH